MSKVMASQSMLTGVCPMAHAPTYTYLPPKADNLSIMELSQRLEVPLFVNVQENIYTLTQPHATNTEVVADDLLDTISSCAICLMSTNVAISSSLSLDGWAEEYSMDLLLYNRQRYHAPCANFWQHFISEDLPTLG